MSLGEEAWWAAMVSADQFKAGSLVIQDDTLDVDGGSTVQLQVKLGARPRSDVTVALSEASTLISLGETSLTFTQDNWDAYQSVTVTAAGNRQSIALGANRYSYVSSTNIKQWSQATPRTQIVAGLRPPNQTRRHFALMNLDGDDGRVVVSIALDATGADTGGRDLTAAFEATGTVTIAAGGGSLTVALAGADMDEPYSWVPSNSAEVITFHGSLSEMSGTVAATITLRDFSPADATISLSASGPDEYAGVTGSATVAVD